MSRLRPSGHGGQARVGCRVSHHWGQPLIFDRPALSAGPTLGRDENSRLGADDDDDFVGGCCSRLVDPGSMVTLEKVTYCRARFQRAHLAALVMVTQISHRSVL